MRERACKRGKYDSGGTPLPSFSSGVLLGTSHSHSPRSTRAGVSRVSPWREAVGIVHELHEVVEAGREVASRITG